MKQNQASQYTIRNISSRLDRYLRDKAKKTGRSLNEVVLNTLENASGISSEVIMHRDLDDLIGTWQDDPQFEEAILAQDQVDAKLWS